MAIADRDQDLVDALRLSLVRGIGPRIHELLRTAFGEPAAIFRASQAELLQVPGVGPKLAKAIVAAARDDSAARRELERCRKSGVKLLLRGAADYPQMLSEIPDAPPVLYCRGRIEASDRLAVGIVGARHCTLYGRQQAERIAGGLARAGVTVVSGLARGIDAAAHYGALQAGGRTIAVMATGLASIYPPEHSELANEVADHGALLTESPLEQKPLAGLFPQRNRIISGISLGVIVVEASRKSGALHTARHAMEQNREVFAIPGRIDSLASEGCHDLIRDGATLLRGVDDVLQSLAPLATPLERTEPKPDGTPPETILTPRELALSDQERAVLNLVTREPQHVDEILRQCDLEHSRVLSTLTVLEMKRFVRRLPGSLLVRST